MCQKARTRGVVFGTNPEGQLQADGPIPDCPLSTASCSLAGWQATSPSQIASEFFMCGTSILKKKLLRSLNLRMEYTRNISYVCTCIYEIIYNSTWTHSYIVLNQALSEKISSFLLICFSICTDRYNGLPVHEVCSLNHKDNLISINTCITLSR